MTFKKRESSETLARLFRARDREWPGVSKATCSEIVTIFPNTTLQSPNSFYLSPSAQVVTIFPQRNFTITQFFLPYLNLLKSCNISPNTTYNHTYTIVVTMAKHNSFSKV